jgi:hypothetical protein
MSALLHAKGAFAGLYERQAGEFGIPSWNFHKFLVFSL